MWVWQMKSNNCSFHISLSLFIYAYIIFSLSPLLPPPWGKWNIPQTKVNTLFSIFLRIKVKTRKHWNLFVLLTAEKLREHKTWKCFSFLFHTLSLQQQNHHDTRTLDTLLRVFSVVMITYWSLITLQLNYTSSAQTLMFSTSFTHFLHHPAVV